MWIFFFFFLSYRAISKTCASGDPCCEGDETLVQDLLKEVNGRSKKTKNRDVLWPGLWK